MLPRQSEAGDSNKAVMDWEGMRVSAALVKVRSSPLQAGGTGGRAPFCSSSVDESALDCSGGGSYRSQAPHAVAAKGCESTAVPTAVRSAPSFGACCSLLNYSAQYLQAGTLH